MFNYSTLRIVNTSLTKYNHGVNTNMADVTKITEQRWQPSVKHDDTASKPVKPSRPLTRKQRAFVAELVKNPKQSATQALAKTYNVKNNNVARQMASENLAKPSILAELAKYDNTAQNILIEVLHHSRDKMITDEKQGVNWAVNARQTADSLLDRIHGKATQKTEQQVTTVNLNLNLSNITDTTE